MKNTAPVENFRPLDYQHTFMLIALIRSKKLKNKNTHIKTIFTFV